MATPKHLLKDSYKTWWAVEKNAAPQTIYDMVAELDKLQSIRRDRNMRSLMLYGSYSGIANQANMGSAPAMPEQRVKLNIVSSMCDTVAAKISKMKPKVTFLTEEGSYETQEEAKKLTKFTQGAFYKNNIYTLHQEGFRDATIYDIGVLKHFIDADLNIKTERCLPSEFYVEDTDATYGRPQTIYQIKKIHKEVLKSIYPKQAKMIEISSGVLNDSVNRQPSMDEYVIVFETWHLPSTKTSEDGRHVICTDKVSLLDEEYTKDYFPFTFFYWSKPTHGFFGQSLAERLLGNQVEINKMLRIIQRSFHLGSAFKVFLEYGSKVSKEHLNNDIGSIVYYAGAKPDFYVPQTVHPEYFRHLDYLVKMSYEEAGISQLSASSKLPAGLDGGSGKALREFNDLETERFVLVAQGYEQSFLQTASIYIDLAKEIAERGGDFEVLAQSKQFMQSIKWSDIKVKENAYIMQMFPTNSLPHTPAGRLAYIQELLQAGLINPKYAKSLLDFPDIEEYDSIDDAALDDLRDTMYSMLKTGEYLPPEPFQDLAEGIKMFQLGYLKAKKSKVKDSKLENLRIWITTAQAMLQQAVVSSAPPPQPMQAAPMAMTPQAGQMSAAPMPAPMAPSQPQLPPPGIVPGR